MISYCLIFDATCSKYGLFLESVFVLSFQANGHSSEAIHQERLSRLENDKECLILQVCPCRCGKPLVVSATATSDYMQKVCVATVQVSVLTDQVEVQGEKIRDLETCLEHHQQKLSATEQLLQQVSVRPS